MGTRSLTHVKGRANEGTILTLYRQFDGYPSGMGEDIKRLLSNTRITNGYVLEDKLPEVANGMGCAAAYLVGELKHGEIGNVYIYPPNASDCGEDYIYTLYPQDNKIYMKCESIGYNKSPNKTLYEGPLSAFNAEAATKFEDE